METSHGTNQSQTRKAAVGGLAVVGFVALILIGIATAIYAATFIPKALSRLGSANVFLSTQDGNEDGLVVANPNGPTDQGAAPTSVPLSGATTTAPAPSYTPPAQPTPTYTAPRPTYTSPTPTYQVITPTYSGRADLVTTINSVGYLRRSGDTSSYIVADTVPSGYQGAVRFTIANRGGNTTGSWTFEAKLPSDSDSTYRSSSQRSLKPGDSLVFTLGFDGSDSGRSTIRIEADQNDRVDESNESNNTDSATIYLNGGRSSRDNDSYDSNGNYCRYGTYRSGNRYYCESSDSNRDSRDYDSNGNYCRYGTYYQNGRYYCDTSSGSSSVYDSFGNLCRSGVRTYQNGIYTCDNNTNGSYYSYDSNGDYCAYGTYYQNGRYYCSGPYGNDDHDRYDSNGNYCRNGTYYSNGRYYCD